MSGFWAWLNTVPDGYIWLGLAAGTVGALWLVCWTLDHL